MRSQKTKRQLVALFIVAVAMSTAPHLAGATQAHVSTPTSVLTGPVLRLGDSGQAVRLVQARLSALRYWVGPIDGRFGDNTQQALYALQKASGLPTTGVVTTATRRALDRGVRAPFRRVSGRAIEVNLSRQLLMVVRDGRLIRAFNTSTGGGYAYSENGVSGVAVTPRGSFKVYRAVNGLDTGPLGDMWRPKYFDGGYAVHGSWSVPPTPVSHGCVRLSLAAMDWMWAANQMPLGARILIY